MADPFLERQRELLGLQRGVITRRQALAAGLTEKAIVVRLKSERWQRLQPGVYATFSGEPPRAAMLWAAVLRAGPGAVLSHHTAAELYGLLDAPVPLIHLTVPNGSKVRRPAGTVVHYSRRLDQARHPALAPARTRVEDSVLDLAGDAASLDEAVSLLLRAVGRRRTTVPLILAALAQRQRMRRRADIIRALDLAAEGAHSLLEYRYVTRVERPHGLPRGTRQRLVRRGGLRQYQDVSYEDYLLVVELDGQAAHPLEFRWRDMRRDNANTASGLATLRLGYVDVTERACVSAAVVGQALQRRGWQGVLRGCGCTCRALM
jgi:putative AbiEi antitoxin of type IV toxin-antitoxin system